jgi:hypothetical protein
MKFDARSANVSHAQSVVRQERGDKLGRVTRVTLEPLESC